jgi:hypothetical protein
VKVNKGKTFATLHTHPNTGSPTPTSQDVENTKKLGIPQYVVSREGLFMVRPSDGQVLQVYKNNDWMNEKKKK